MAATRISSVTDIHHWADCGGDPATCEALASAAQGGDHPAYGRDWSAYLAGVGDGVQAAGGNHSAVAGLPDDALRDCESAAERAAIQAQYDAGYAAGQEAGATLGTDPAVPT